MMRNWQWPVIACYVFLSTAIVWRYQLFPSTAEDTDASGYIGAALSFARWGFSTGLNAKTYGYPFFIYLYSLLAGHSPTAIVLTAGVSQVIVYGVATLWLASCVAVVDVRFGKAIAMGLLLNPVLVAMVADVLAEGLTAILAVLALVCLVKLMRARTIAGIVAWAALGAAATNFSLMVRPANLVLIAAWNGACLFALFFDQGNNARRRALVLLVYVTVWAASAAATWTPQYLLTGNILPTGLFDFGVQTGMLLIKYATFINTSGKAQGLLYPNPWCVHPFIFNGWWSWFIAYPGLGLATIAGHIFSAFSFEYLFTYVYDRDPIYSIPLAATMWLVTAIGLFNGVRLLVFSKTPMSLPVIIMVSCLFFMTIGLISLIAVENRYSMIPVAILSVSAAEYFLVCRKPHRLFIAALCVSALATPVSEKFRATARTGDEVRFQCFKP
jgi:hypothetical protein